MFHKKKSNSQARRSTYLPPAEVFSYHSHRSVGPNQRRMPGQSTEKPRYKVGRWLRILPTLLSVGAIVVSIFYVTSLSTTPRLQVRDNAGTPLLRDVAVYEDAASAILKRSIFNHSKLTINTTKLAQDLSVQYPELSNVAIIIPLSGHRPVIEIKPVEPALKLAGSGGDVFVVDGHGRALLKADETSVVLSSDIPLVIDQSGLKLEKGKQVLPLSTIDFISELTVQVHKKGLQIESMTLPPIPNELHLRLVGVSYYVKFDTQGIAREQAGTFNAAQERLQAGGTLPNEYIDVRVPEKAFYR